MKFEANLYRPIVSAQPNCKHKVNLSKSICTCKSQVTSCPCFVGQTTCRHGYKTQKQIRMHVPDQKNRHQYVFIIILS